MNVLLVHGLGRTPLSLFGLASALRSAGHSMRFFAYTPTFESLHRIVRRLARLLKKLSRMTAPIAAIGHSLGGVLLRMALASDPTVTVKPLILLGTPSRSPLLAGLAWRWLPFRLVAGECGRFLADSEGFGRLPTIPTPATVIAGTAGPHGRYSPFGNRPNDGIVGAWETHIDPPSRVLHFPVLHTFMMNSIQVRTCIASLLETDAEVTSDAVPQQQKIATTRLIPIVARVTSLEP